MKKPKHLETLAVHVAGGKTIRQAAGIVGISEATAYGFSATDDFRDEVRRLRTQAVEQAVSILTSNATKASQALVKLLESKDQKIVLAASSKLLAMLGPMAELHELRARIDAIEKQGTTLRVAR